MAVTNKKWNRLYINGIDFSGVTNDPGDFSIEQDTQEDAALSQGVMNTTLGRSIIKAGPVNAFLAPGTLGPFELAALAEQTYYYMWAVGVGAEPAIGDHMRAWVFNQPGTKNASGEGFATISIPEMSPSPLQPAGYECPYGFITHAYAARTAANSAVTTLDDRGASSALGGLFWWHLFSSDGTVTLSLDDSATNANNAAFAALSGATSGSIDASSSPKYGVAALGLTATVRRYLRWQVAFGTATTATFVTGFMRR